MKADAPHRSHTEPLARVRRKPPRAAASAPATPPAEEGLQWISARLEKRLVRDLDAHAEKAGITRSDAIRDCLALGLETFAERGGIPGGRAEELLTALDGIQSALDILGPPTFGLVRLIAHWAVQAGGLKVSEDELLTEIRNVGADEWEEHLGEAVRPLHGNPTSNGNDGSE